MGGDGLENLNVQKLLTFQSGDPNSFRAGRAEDNPGEPD
jgi:hypothetical protein